jgi:hypothetical protein
MFHKIEAWTKAHKYLAIATGIAFLVLIWIIFNSGSSSSTTSNLPFNEQLQLMKQQDSTQLSLARIQEQAATAPYSSQTQIAQTQAQAAENINTTNAGVSTTGIAAQLQQALAAIAGNIQVTNNQTAAGVTEAQYQESAEDTSAADQLQAYLANISGVEQEDQEQAQEQTQEEQYNYQEGLLSTLASWAQNPNAWYNKLAAGEFSDLIGQGSWFQQWLG